MFSNRQQQNSSNLLHQAISSSGSIVLPPPPPAIAIPTMVSSNSSAVTSVATTILALDGLNCGGIPTRTTPTLTPTTLRTIAADIAGLSPGPSENFAAAASDLHHLVSSSCSSINTSTLEPTDRTDLQECVSIQNLSNQTISLQSLNNQQISLNNLQNQQNVNQNTLNQQQRNDYNNSFSAAASRQAGFVPPLVLQINSSNPSVQQSSGTTILLNNNNSSGSSSIFNAKGSSTSTSSSHWQGAVVTQRPQNGAQNVTRRQFTDEDDEDNDDYDSIADDGTDSSDTTSSKTTLKRNTKNNKSSSKNSIKNEFKNSTGGGRRTNNKDNKMMSAEEEQRRQVRRERNKLAAARCRKRRMDHTNELLEETGQLEEKRLRLQVEIQGLRQQKSDLQQMLAQHKCAVNMNNVQLSNSITTVNHASTILDSNEISETKPTVLSNHLSSIKGNPLQQNISTNIVINDNDSNNVDDIIIKREDNSIIQTDIDNKDSINIIPTSVMQQSQRRRPTTLLQLNNGNFGNTKKISGNGSTGVVVLNFDSLMDGGTGLTPVSSSGGSVQNHQQVQHSSTGNSGVNTENNSVLS
ncbi:transcription factor kayak isoform X2 [Myzus persicae]|uniref:transcription factor kayak isoform X2 n=1 Tax=Myzus persicae TaxID=13164 RepID=UPI000B93860B|nr:transcription factor kayak isoform X2 [Myzus persicae]XP_022172904.1 transcription factor kayak isoform X2 [Myzus persicae]XP_022172905.1 transcription factor kayak isoform X2 [Myzus persicae]